MRIGNRTVAVALTAVVLSCVGTGCVGLDEYRQLEMDHRTSLAEKEQLQQDLYDCRNVSDSLRSKMTSLEGELDTKEQLVANLQQENNRLAQKADEMAKIAEELAKKGLTEPVVIERKLPPELDTALKDFAAKFPDAVTYDAKRGTVKWASDLLFALGSDVVKESAKEPLATFAEIVRSPAAADFDTLIAGHTDNLPIKRSATAAAHPTNWHLSAHRAIAVGRELESMGIEPVRIGVSGFSEYRPIEDNSSEQGRAKNRRVEIYIVPKGTVASGETRTGGTLDEAPLSASETEEQQPSTE